MTMPPVAAMPQNSDPAGRLTVTAAAASSGGAELRLPR
jgi:hypothetical protein